MPLNRSWLNSLIDDDGSDTTGTPWNKATLGQFHDVIDAGSVPPALHAASHKSGGSDPLRLDELGTPVDNTSGNATTSAHGFLPKLAGGTALFLRADGTWASASGGAPSAHATTHKAGGSDLLRLDELGAPTDVLTGNVSTTTHGLVPKLPGGTATFLRSDGTWAAAPGGLHALTHSAGASDQVDVRALAGFPSNTATFLRGDGTFAAPGGTGFDEVFIGPSDPGAAYELWYDTDEPGVSVTVTAHAVTHQVGGGDVVDVKLLGGFPGGTTLYLRADGTFAAPAGGGGSGTYTDFPEGVPANPAADVARLYSVDASGFTFLEVRDSAGLALRLSRDFVAVGKVAEAAGIAKGQAVYVSGASGSNRLIKLARADAIGTLPAVGIALEAGAVNAFIRVLTAGLLSGVNTSAFADGDELYVSATTAGALTAVHPVAPNYIQRIGTVLRALAAGDLGVAMQPPFSESGFEAVHATMHKSGGRDPIKLDELAAPTDVTTLNVSATAHGLAPKFPNNTTTFLRGDGTYAVPAGGGNVSGPGSSVTTNIATWNGTTGTLLADGGVALAALERTATKNAASGYAGLDGSSKLTGAQVPYGTATNTACQGNDARLSDARTPTAHATTHKAGGSDLIKLDEFAAPTDVTTLNATTSAHGLLPKLSGVTTTFLRGDGTFAVPAGTGGGGTGDVVGPASSTDNAIARFDATTGKLLQDSVVTLDDTGAITIPDGVSLFLGTSGNVFGQNAAGGILHLAAGGVVYIDIGGSAKYNLYPLAFFSTVDATCDLGTSGNRFKDLYLSGVVNAAGLASTPLNATNLTTGALPDARLSVNVLKFTGGFPGTASTALCGDGTFKSRTGVVGFVIDGAGAAITTGVKGFIEIPFAGTITGVTILSVDAAATAGSIVVDLWRDTYTNYPPTVADTITASAKPTLSSANKNKDTTLTGWNKTVNAGDILGFNVDSATTVTRVLVSLTIVAT